MDAAAYQSYLADKETEYENICKRCGRCCGAYGDPCQRLLKLEDERYICTDYKNRLSLQRTIKGVTFHCIPVSLVIQQGAVPAECAYLKTSSNGHID